MGSQARPQPNSTVPTRPGDCPARVLASRRWLAEHLPFPHRPAQNRLHSVRRPYQQKPAPVEPLSRTLKG